jgi:hypothetical protein
MVDGDSHQSLGRFTLIEESQPLDCDLGDFIVQRREHKFQRNDPFGVGDLAKTRESFGTFLFAGRIEQADDFCRFVTMFGEQSPCGVGLVGCLLVLVWRNPPIANLDVSQPGADFAVFHVKIKRSQPVSSRFVFQPRSLAPQCKIAVAGKSITGGLADRAIFRQRLIAT